MQKEKFIQIVNLFGNSVKHENSEEVNALIDFFMYDTLGDIAYDMICDFVLTNYTDKTISNLYDHIMGERLLPDERMMEHNFNASMEILFNATQDKKLKGEAVTTALGIVNPLSKGKLYEVQLRFESNEDNFAGGDITFQSVTLGEFGIN